MSCIQIQHCFRREEQWRGEGGGGGRGGEGGEGEGGGREQHRKIFSHNTGQLAKFGWILTYLKIGH